MKNLVEILTEQTQDLKNLYIEKVQEWATSYHKAVSARKNWSVAQWCKFLGIQPEVRNTPYSNNDLIFPKGFYNSFNGKTYNSLYNEAISMSRISVEKFKAKEVKKAEIHYNMSILKLADRILKKGLDETKLEVTASRLDINFEALITDGSKTVRAWTIVASGEIQRPHYRYLVK
jgi:hypothetical protein